MGRVSAMYGMDACFLNKSPTMMCLAEKTYTQNKQTNKHVNFSSDGRVYASIVSESYAMVCRMLPCPHPLCLSVCLFVCLSLSVHTSVYQSTFLCLSLNYVCLSVYLPFSVRPYFRRSVYLPLSVSQLCLSVRFAC